MKKEERRKWLGKISLDFVNELEGSQTLNYNWGASCVWFARKDRMLTGLEVQVGDVLLGFREEGFRSNGLSLVRKIVENKGGVDWHTADNLGEDMARQILQPSRIYSGAVVEMMGGVYGEPKVDVHGVVHITGGGLPGKLGRVLRPSSLGARIDQAMMPPDIMKQCQEWGQVTDYDAYQTWNMGQGMVIAVPGYDVQKAIDVAEEHGIKASPIGKVVHDKTINVISRGHEKPGEMLTYHPDKL